MIGFANWPRALIAMALASVLALLLGAHAVSGVLSKSKPEIAISAFGWNGVAKSELAFAALQATEGSDQTGTLKKRALELARSAVRQEPLTPKGLAVLALTEEDEASRSRLVSVASRLNRRALALQGLALTEHVRSGDFPATIETLDQILRIHPGYSREAFPLLVKTFVEQDNVSPLAELIDGTSPWHDKFLRFAVKQPEALTSLARLREESAIVDETFDKELIARLVSIGAITDAYRIYRAASASAQTASIDGRLDWQSAYPPFDWLYSDEPGFRAQQTIDGNGLEVFIRPGKGGVFASRLRPNPAGPFTIRVDHEELPLDQADDVQLRVSCAGSGLVLLEQQFAARNSVFRIPDTTADCSYLMLEMIGRAWSGRSRLAFIIENISIES